ncbi:LacI family DNA-binding transcriptional regulator [Paenibacillus thiaminolyticus]|uniref:LacI family DNA-binding transcriptional regulator n=1 Tax=Paenibacillus thiaminolyticus TaxID=49283 RepID=UPI0035A62E8F
MSHKTKVTQQHIADALGLSRNTVSKALNNDPGLREDTKRRVLQKAVELGYMKIHHELTSSETYAAENRLVALLTHSDYMGNPYWMSFLKGLNATLKEAGCTLTMTIVDMEEERQLLLPGLFHQQKPAGVITIGPFLREYYEMIASTGTASLFIDTHADYKPGDLKCDILLADNKHSVHTLASKLIDQGHRNIGFVGDVGSCLSYRERWEGFQLALRERGMDADEDYCIINRMQRHYYTEAELREAFHALKRKPTAFVCVNDAIAIELMNIIRELGLSIPGDIALTGFDNIAESILVQPSLTTVHVPKEEMGMRAGDQIVWRMDHPKRPNEMIRLDVEMMWRES